MTSIEILAPAKVNLFLKVLNKRKDSYHNILTVFEKISLADKIRISKIPKGIIVSSNRFITHDPKENLVYKAAELILNRAKQRSGVKIKITKNIPIASGLGGGSSDAAAVLVGINRFFNLGLKKKVLLSLARRLGADVPFLILEAPFAVGTGRGDRLKTINSKARFWHLLIYPGFGVSTKEIYEAFDNERSREKHLSNPSADSGFDPEFIEGSKYLTPRLRSGSSLEPLSKDLTRKADGVKIHLPLIFSMDFDTVESMLHNDLEDTVKSEKSEIGKIIKRLASSLGKRAILSGSGPSLFCLYRTRKEAVRGKKTLLRSIPASELKGWQIFVARTLS